MGRDSHKTNTFTARRVPFLLTYDTLLIHLRLPTLQQKLVLSSLSGNPAPKLLFSLRYVAVAMLPFPFNQFVIPRRPLLPEHGRALTHRLAVGALSGADVSTCSVGCG